jgi:hypothetical protein
MSHLYLPSTAALLVFLILGAVDGLYLHLWRYRLYARPASTREHLYHTIAAVTFAATLPAVFLWETGGLLLWAGILLIGADMVVSLADMLAENDSRADLGGLSRGEYVLHMVIMTAKGSATSLALAARPEAAWAFDAAWILQPLPAFAAFVGWQAFPGAVVIGALHLWLCMDSGIRTLEVFRTRAGAAVSAWRGSRIGCCPTPTP